MPNRTTHGAAKRPDGTQTAKFARFSRLGTRQKCASPAEREAGDATGNEARVQRATTVHRNSPHAAFSTLYATLLTAMVVWLAAPFQAGARTLFMRGETNAVGVESALTVLLDAQDGENTVGFSLAFATNNLTFVSAAPGSNALGAALVANTNMADMGQVGFALALPAGQRFAAGTNELLRVRFMPLAVSNAPVLFADSPVTSEIVDTNANALTTVYSTGMMVSTPMIAPGIAMQPTNLTVYVGANVSLSLVVTGSAPLAIQWRKDGDIVSGATNANCVLSSVTLSQSGNYQAVVSNPGGSVTSAVATLLVLPAPVAPGITQQPVGRTMTVGETVDFTVVADGTAPLRYQWLLNNATLPGRTNATLLLTNIQTLQAGNYTVVVSNLAGTARSATATLTVSALPRVVRVASQLAGVGGFVEVPVELVAFGEESAVGFSLEFDPSRLQFVGAEPGVDALDGQFQLNAAQEAAGRIGIAVTKGFGQSFVPGTRQLANVTFQVLGGLGVTPVKLGDTPVWRELADVFGEMRPTAFSNGTVTVVAPPTILSQPESRTVPVFSNLTLAVTATGAPPLSYQWRKNGTNLAGETGTELKLTHIEPSQRGVYSVLVGNVGGVKLSADATIEVARVISIDCPNPLLGQTSVAVVKLLAAGDENAVGFSLRFDPARLRFVDWQPGPDAADAIFNVNTNETASGRMGVAVAMPGLNAMPIGMCQVFVARFAAVQSAWETTLSFTDTPVPLELVDENAEPLPSAFVSATVAIEPALKVDLQGRVFLRGPTNGIYSMAKATNILGPWLEFSVPKLSNSIQQVAAGEMNLPMRFYKVKSFTTLTNWSLVWRDEFDQPDGSAPDPANWTYNIGYSFNNELEYYTNSADNARIEGGNLVIQARQEVVNGTNGYTSARLKTEDRQSWTYGRFEARIKIPRGQGIWPAFWMLGTNIDTVSWPACGEIDIMENIGKEPNTIYGTIHGVGYSGENAIGWKDTLPGDSMLADEFHVYAIEWETNCISWFVDDQKYRTVTPSDLQGKQWVFDSPQFLLLSLAVGGDWPGQPTSETLFPQTMLVDYVRVYKRNTQ